MKKLIALLLAVVMVFALGSMTFAADDEIELDVSSPSMVPTPTNGSLVPAWTAQTL